MHELYREHLLEHYRHPHNATPLADLDAVAEDDNPLCGDRVRAEVKCNSHGRLAAVTFIVHGCVIATATASLLSDAVAGMSAAQVERITYETLLGILGVMVGPGRAPCALLPLSVLRQALARVSTKKSS